jgi:hypothetical protein
MRRLRYAALIALLIGCGGGGSFWVVVEFPAGYQDEAATLDVYAIEPGAAAACSALVEGTAFPGDAGYQVEDTIGVSLPVEAGARALENIGPGRRLFYAQGKDAQDVIIMTGCTEAQTGGSGVQEVLIKLDWTCRETNGGVEACDGVDNNCDGSTDEGDLADLCAAVDNATATACDQGQCVYECSTGWGNANDDWSDGCECQITRNGEEWCDGLDNDCDGETDPAGCLQCQSHPDCDDDDACNDPDVCNNGVCEHQLPRDCSHLDSDCASGTCNPQTGLCEAQPANEGVGCNDGLYCTEGETCSSGTCAGGTALDCSGSGDQCNDGACNEVDDVCEAQPKTDGTACDDQNTCSSLDTCQGGLCIAGATDLDGDGDTYFDILCPDGDDCDDGDQTVNPGATEGPNGDPTCGDNKDNDCDTTTDMNDDGCTGSTQIYRSVGRSSSDLNVNSRSVEISGTTADFSGSMPDNIGVGDVLQYTGPGGGWWNANYLYRRQLTVNAGDALEAGYSIETTIDTAALEGAGKVRPDRRDWRVIYFDGNSSVEIDRHYRNAASTWFSLQAAIPASGSDDGYYVYYGYSGETTDPLSDEDNVYFFHDGFSGSSVDSSKWPDASGSISVSGGQAHLTGGAYLANEGLTSSDLSNSWAMEGRFTWISGSDAAFQFSPSNSADPNGVGLLWDSGSECELEVNGGGEIPIMPDNSWNDRWVRSLVTHVSGDSPNTYGYTYVEDTGLDGTATGNSGNPSSWHILFHGASASFFDWIVLRKYVSNEPAVVEGAEEQNQGYHVAFIHQRISDTIYSVRSADGGDPQPCPAGTAVDVYRAYRYLDDWEAQDENNSLNDSVENFDTSDDLVALDVVLNVACYADGLDDDDVDLYGWTTGPDNPIRIYTPVSPDEVGISQRHDGTAGTGFVMGGDSTSGMLTIGVPHVTVEGIEFDSFTATGNGASAIVVDGASDVTIDKVIVHGYQHATYSLHGILVADDGSATITNSVIYDGDPDGAGIYTWGSSPRATVYNTTVYSTGSGVGGDAGTIVAVNVVSMGNNWDDFWGPLGAMSSNNLSSDNTAPGNNSLTGLSASGQFVSINPGSEDFHLKAGADAINAGLPLGMFFDDDIDGESRGLSWDMGADEL